MYDLMLSSKPNLKIDDNTKLCFSRKPCIISWVLLSISVLIFFQMFRRITDNIFLTIVSILGITLFGLDTFGEWEDFVLDKKEKKATITRSTWSEKWIFRKTQETTMKLSEICHVGASMGLGLFILCRNGKIFRLDTRGLNRRKIQNYRKEIHRFLNTRKLSTIDKTQEKPYEKMIIHSDSEDEKRLEISDSASMENLRFRDKFMAKRLLDRRSSVTGFQCCTENPLRRGRFMMMRENNADKKMLTLPFVFSQGLVNGLQEIDKLKGQVQDVHVPLEVFDYIDQGRNPQLYTKDCIEKALTKNEQVKGKIDAYRKFKANMLVELNRVFPNELTKYRAIRGDE